MTGTILHAPSLLDRMLDDAPELSFDPPRTRQQVLRDTRAALRRDLEMLLNTRCAPTTPPPGLPELRFSVLGYGIPDFIGTGMAGRDARDAFARRLEAAVRLYEPRLQDVRITVLDSRNTAERLLRLRIEAVAVLHEGAVPITLASALDPTTMRFQVGEDRVPLQGTDGAPP